MQLTVIELAGGLRLGAHLALLPARNACLALFRIHFEVFCTPDLATAYTSVACLASQGYYSLMWLYGQVAFESHSK